MVDQKEKGPSPLDVVIDIEADRVRKGIPTKQDLCKMAGIEPAMYSYMLRRGKQGHELPEDCLRNVLRALKAVKPRQ